MDTLDHSSTIQLLVTIPPKTTKSTSKKMKICAVVFISLTLIILNLIGLVVDKIIGNQKQGITAKAARLTSRISLQSAYNMFDKMDKNINPCDDFWSYSCGKYIVKYVPVESEPYSREINVKADMQHSTDEKVIRLLEEADTETTIQPVKMVKKLYSSCTNRKILAKTMKSDLVKLSENLGGVPMITGRTFSGNHSSILRKYFHVTGKLPLFTYYILGKDFGKIINFQLAAHGYSKFTESIAASMKLMFSESINFDNIFQFYLEMTHLTKKNYNSNEDELLIGAKYTSTELNKYLSGFDLESIFNDILNVKNETVTNFRFVTQSPEVLKYISRLILGTDTADFMNILFLEVVQDFYGVIPVLGKTLIDSIYNNKRSNSYPFLSAPIEKKTCLDVAHLAGDVLGWMYNEKHFDKQAVEKAYNMVYYLLKATHMLLKRTEWLDNWSKTAALAKLDHLNKHIYIGRHNSKHVADELIENYANVDITDNFLSNIIKLGKVSSHIARILKKHESTVSQNTVNAFYNTLSNSITVPIALLQPPLFHKGASMVLNFGGLGTLIGHEIFHAFDVNDVNLDIYEQWLSEPSRHMFQELKRGIVKSYSQYKVESIKSTINGEKTAMENIADIGGLKIAYEAYSLWRLDNPDVEVYIPAIKMTETQIFFTAFSQTWCSSEKPRTVKYSLSTNVHSPPEARVQIPLQMYNNFNEAFSCPNGSKMNPEYKNEIW